MPRASAIRLTPLALGLLAAVPAARAQEAGPIATDRPGFAFNPTVVPQGAFQVEIGTPFVTRFNGADDASATAVSLPTGLRYGLTPRFEVRLNSSVYNSSRVSDGDDSETVDGFGDVEIGAKYQLLVSDGSSPNLALLPSVIVPTGEDGFTAGDPVIGLNASAGLPLPNGLGATFVAGVTIPTADESNATGNFVAVLGRSFTPVISGYVEAAAFPTDGSTPLFAGAGLAYLVSNTVQIDVSFDVGLNDDAPDLLGGFGISVRFGR